MSPRARAVPRVVLEDEVIAQIAELPAELTSNLGNVDIGERRIAVRISRNCESGRARMGRAPPCGRLSESQRHGERGEELPSSEHWRLVVMIRGIPDRVVPALQTGSLVLRRDSPEIAKEI